MATSTDCLPWWHSTFDTVSDAIVDSGCPIGSDGNATCDPETMRAATEAQIGSSLTLEAYSLARYIQSEVGTRSIEEAVAVAEAAVNRAALEGSGINDVLLYRTVNGVPGSGYGFYGPIHGIGTGTSTAPYGRWASTSQDPSYKAIAIAQLVASGDSGNFANGADDQDGPEAWINQGQGALNNYVVGLAHNGKFWVGPLPGIDHWHTFLQYTDHSVGGADAQALIQRGQDALSLPARRPTWDLPVCSKPILLSLLGSNSTWKTIAIVAGLLAGAWIAHRRATDQPLSPWA
jgi:hypothetical protein